MFQTNLFRYVPTLWGYSGHLSTVFHSIVGRVKCPWPSGDRIFLTLDDNSTLTFDLYQPLNEPNGMYKKSNYLFNVTHKRNWSIVKLWGDVKRRKQIVWHHFNIFTISISGYVKRKINENNNHLHSTFYLRFFLFDIPWFFQLIFPINFE